VSQAYIFPVAQVHSGREKRGKSGNLVAENARQPFALDLFTSALGSRKRTASSLHDQAFTKSCLFHVPKVWAGSVVRWAQAHPEDIHGAPKFYDLQFIAHHAPRNGGRLYQTVRFARTSIIPSGVFATTPAMAGVVFYQTTPQPAS